jgi:hypothetical protein
MHKNDTGIWDIYTEQYTHTRTKKLKFPGYQLGTETDNGKRYEWNYRTCKDWYKILGINKQCHNTELYTALNIERLEDKLKMIN